MMNLENAEAVVIGQETPLNPPADSTSAPPIYLSEDLFRGQRELLIQHQGETYRLRITRTSKLILTK